MKTFSLITLVTVLSSLASASLLSTTNVATVLSTVTNQKTLTVPAAALSAIKKLGAGGANAAALSAADKAAIDTCVTDARNNNTASKAGLGQGTGSAGNIVFVAAKTTLHACETAQQQITLAGGGKSASDTAVTLLIKNVGVLNVNIKAVAGGKRAMAFEA